MIERVYKKRWFELFGTCEWGEYNELFFSLFSWLRDLLFEMR